MSAMLRMKDEKELQDFLKRSPGVRVAAARIIQPLGDQPTKKVVIDAKKAREPSEIEELFASQIILVKNLPAPIREYPFLRGSRHRLDFAWPEYRINGMQLGVEIQGHVHRIRSRFMGDLEKRALALMQDWLILEIGGDQVRSGKGMEWLQELFKRAVKA